MEQRVFTHPSTFPCPCRRCLGRRPRRSGKCRAGPARLRARRRDSVAVILGPRIVSQVGLGSVIRSVPNQCFRGVGLALGREGARATEEQTTAHRRPQLAPSEAGRRERTLLPRRRRLLLPNPTPLPLPQQPAWAVYAALHPFVVAVRVAEGNACGAKPSVSDKRTTKTLCGLLAQPFWSGWTKNR